MAYGFQVTSGDQPLSPALMEAIAEIRIEQELSKATKFGIRFEDDLCSGNPKAISEPSLKAGKLITVLVPGEIDSQKGNTSSICLVRGPVTKRKSSVVLGGPASWLEIHGEDRRVEMDRETKGSKWTGKAPDIVQAILSTYQFNDPDIDQGSNVQFTDKKSLNQSSTDLKLIEELARKLGFEFWLTYDVGQGGKVTEKFHFRPSPNLAPSAGGIGGALAGAVAAAAAAIGIDQLKQDKEKVLKLSIADTDCSNLTAFDVDVDAERVTAILLDGVDDKTGKATENKAEDTEPKVDPKATASVKDFGNGVTRTGTGAGDAEDRASEAKSIVADEAWFVTATASTSAYKLPGVVQHHDIVSVDGTGFLYTGKYQVSKVLHVINGWGHLMDITLRRNALPEALRASVGP